MAVDYCRDPSILRWYQEKQFGGELQVEPTLCVLDNFELPVSPGLLTKTVFDAIHYASLDNPEGEISQALRMLQGHKHLSITHFSTRESIALILSKLPRYRTCGCQNVSVAIRTGYRRKKRSSPMTFVTGIRHTSKILQLATARLMSSSSQ
ncbi:hypothetical protein L228DRAFT_262845 [Xylona heveae TC161]|uniref:Uncharacterized protein n=1 Tax=Xylona heveae (strain CBS 132557 / TC161) TaxID=1328760 RepID=A0A165AA38_XYLHT|nr:hypothetical protein L228DRAFT_262845 [Xylona heveae TC161]KZF20156.1 hypothetical protein L228DRAFT_262845 [Xylona heveae TC161]